MMLIGHSNNRSMEIARGVTIGHDDIGKVPILFEGEDRGGIDHHMII